MQRLILAASVRLLNAIRALLLSAGIAGLAATVASWAFTYVNAASGSPWTAPYRGVLVAAIAAFLTAAIGFAGLMPGATDLAPDRTSRGGTPSLPVAAALVALGILTGLQVPSIAAWWHVDRALLADAMGPSADPLGLQLIPTVILLALPALAGVTIGAFVLTSVVGAFARRDRAAVALSACVLLQAGCVSGVWLALRAVRQLGATVQSLIDEATDPTAAAQVSAFLARHDAPASDASSRLAWMLGGYVLAVAVAAASSATRGNEQRTAESTLAQPN